MLQAITKISEEEVLAEIARLSGPSGSRKAPPAQPATTSIGEHSAKASGWSLFRPNFY